MTAYVRGCYYTNWSQYRHGKGRFVPEDYEPGLCTHIFYAFGTISNDFHAKAFDPADLPNDWQGAGLYARVVSLKKKDPDLKVLLSFGGWNFGTAIFKRLASTPSSRVVFVSSALAFIDEHGFDGIDIDWEYPETTDRDNYVLLMRELKEAFGPRLVTAAVSAAKSKVDAGYDVVSLASILDLCLIMTYDFHGGWEQFVGHNSPLYSHPSDTTDFNMAAAMEYWARRGMPSHKLVVGIAAYGRGWKLVDPNNIRLGSRGTTAPAGPLTGEAGYCSYYEMCTLLEKGAKRYWDEVAKVPFLVHGDLWYGYDDTRSVNVKMDFVKEKGFGGAFVWAMDLDDFAGQCGSRYPILVAIGKKLAPEGPGTSPFPWTHPSTPSTPLTTVSSFTRSTTTPLPPRPPQPGPTTTSAPSTTTRDSSGGFVCPTSNGFFAVPGACHRFAQCANGLAYVKDCPPGTEWSSSKVVCDFPPFSDCGGRRLQ